MKRPPRDDRLDVAALALVVLIVAVWVARTISRLPDVSLLKHIGLPPASESWAGTAASSPIL